MPHCRNNLKVLILIDSAVIDSLSCIRCQFKKNKVRDYIDSDSDCDEYDQLDRGLILRQVTHSSCSHVLSVRPLRKPNVCVSLIVLRI